MPTSTVPFEVSLEFLNDASGPVMLQLSRGDGEVSGGATLRRQSLKFWMRGPSGPRTLGG